MQGSLEPAAAAKAAKACNEATWYAVDATGTASKLVIDDKASVCKTVQSVAPIAIEVEVPSEAFHMTRVIHIRGAAAKHAENTEATPVGTVIRTAKVAATLGRAFVTTVGAVLGRWSTRRYQPRRPWSSKPSVPARDAVGQEKPVALGHFDQR